MTLGTLLLTIIGIFAFAWLAHFVITTFFPEPMRTPALLIVGVLLLLVLLSILFPNVSGIRLW